MGLQRLDTIGHDWVDTIERDWTRLNTIEFTRLDTIENVWKRQTANRFQSCTHDCETRLGTIETPSLPFSIVFYHFFLEGHFVLNSLVPTCSKNGMCNCSGAHLYLCMTESCIIARTQFIRCTNDRCSIFPTDTVFSKYGAELYLCAIEPCPIGRAKSTRCTVGWCTIVSTGSVSSRHGAQLFSCTIGPCPGGCAQSIPYTVVWCSIGTIPFRVTLLNSRKKTPHTYLKSR